MGYEFAGIFKYPERRHLLDLAEASPTEFRRQKLAVVAEIVEIVAGRLAAIDHSQHMVFLLRQQAWIDEKMAKCTKIGHRDHERAAGLEYPVNATQSLVDIRLPHMFQDMTGVDAFNCLIRELTEVLGRSDIVDIWPRQRIKDAPAFLLLPSSNMQFHGKSPCQVQKNSELLRHHPIVPLAIRRELLRRAVVDRMDRRALPDVQEHHVRPRFDGVRIAARAVGQIAAHRIGRIAVRVGRVPYCYGPRHAAEIVAIKKGRGCLVADRLPAGIEALGRLWPHPAGG